MKSISADTPIMSLGCLARLCVAEWTTPLSTIRKDIGVIIIIT